MRRRRFNLRVVIENAAVIGTVALLALLVANLISFSNTRALLPPGSRLGDTDVSGITVDGAISKTIASLDAPVVLRASGALSLTRALRPSEVDFRLNDVIARLQLQPTIDQQQSLGRFPAFIVRQYSPPIQIALPYQYSETKLQTILGELARQLNRDTHDAVPDLATRRVITAQDGVVLNVAEAARVTVSALASADARVVDLPVDVIAARAANVQTLRPALLERLKSFTSIDGNMAAVFVKDLQTGDEISLNGDVAVSAGRWLKLALVAEGVRVSPWPISTTARDQLAAVLVQENNAVTNAVLPTLGSSDAQSGVDALNAMLNKIGLRNTFLAQPFDWATRPPTVATPANARGDINAAPDANAQSTAADMGMLLEMLAQCRDNAGALPLVYADSFGEDKCATLLDMLALDKSGGLLRAGSGDHATVLRRATWDDFNHGDAALIATPKRTYIIAVVLHGKEKLNWADTSPVIADIARLVYGFYNGDLPSAAPPLAGPPGP